LSGRRCKWLRREFKREFRRPVRKTTWGEAVETKTAYRSKVRTRLGWLIGKLRKLTFRTVKQAGRSEWRSLKRLWREEGFNAMEAFRRAA
jgi:hypothetical protein